MNSNQIGMFMKWYLLLAISLLIGCNARYEVMTRKGYDEVDVGMASQVIEKRFGKPYKVYSKGGSIEIYEYIERILVGTQVAEQCCYYFVVDKGRVVNKYARLSNPPAFEEVDADDSLN